MAREWFRHRVGSFNEESARYHRLEGDFYVPPPTAVRSQVGKPGAYSFEPVAEDLADETIDTFRRVYKELYQEYEALVEKGMPRSWRGPSCRSGSSRSSIGRSTPAR